MPRLNRATLYQSLARVPLPLLYRMAAVLYPLLYHVARYRRRTVAENLAHAFPELNASARLELERRFYRHICDLIAEIFAKRHMTEAELAERVRFENPEVLQAVIDNKQSFLLLGIHQANWEWLLARVGYFLPCPMHGIYKPLHDEAMDTFILESRAQAIKPVPFQNAGREILRGRRQFRAFAMLADQAPFKRDSRYWHAFFNRPASFYLGPQKLAEAAQCPVVFVAMKKTARGEYSVRFEVLAEPPYGRDGFDILDRYIAACETAIRAQPETWLWSNRKWKHQPTPEELNASAAAEVPN
jgi:KDO2-lipid IV(A) lauroyltransferase